MGRYNQYNDAELVKLMSQGDHSAYLEIYDRYKTPLQRHAWKKLGQAQDVQDVIQELFTELWLRRKELNMHTGLMNYLFIAVRNRSLNLIYKKRKERSYLDSLDEFIRDGNYLIDIQIQEKEYNEQISREIALLPARMQEVFKLSREQFLSHKEIAERLGTSEHTVTKQISNALKILRKKLGPLYFLIYLIQF